MTEKKELYEKKFLINPKIIGLIILLALGFQVSLYFELELEGFHLFEALNILIIFAVSFSGFLVSKKYGFSNIFGKSYFALGLGMILYFFGYMLESDSFPSFADVFYFLVLVLFIYHLQKNIRFFKGPLNIATKILIVCIPVIIVFSYVSLSLYKLDETVFNFVYLLPYVSILSITLSLAILGGIVFRHNVLINTWFLIATSIFIFTVAEIWYIHLELFGMYYYTHPVNSLYIASGCFMTYALFKHLKAI